jgi:RimJ/RimL family protein N-acetyltransferase
MPDRSDACEYAVAICERFYGHGVAAVAMTLAIQIAVNSGFRKHYVYIRADNEKSQRMFRKAGFEKTVRTKTQFIENLNRMAVMEEWEYRDQLDEENKGH